MHWIPLLSSVIRLVDLHDSRRDSDSLVQMPQETRPGNKDGHFLALGTSVLEALAASDRSATEDFVPFPTLLAAVRKQRPIAEDDLRYVLNLLRYRTELWYLANVGEDSAPALQSTKETAPVQRSTNADEYRLTPTGRAATSMASAYRGVAYIEGEALNILRAIEGNDYLDVLSFCDELIQKLRREIIDVKALTERRGQLDQVERFRKNEERYRKAITGTALTIRDAEAQFALPAVIERFEEWRAQPTAPDISYDQITHRLTRVRQALERFNRNLSALVEDIAQNRTAGVAPPAFLDFSLQLIRRPMDEARLDRTLLTWGASGLLAHFPSPLDGLGAVKARASQPATEGAVFDLTDAEPVSHLGRLSVLDRYGEQMLEALRQGPVKLTEAIDRGWCYVDSDFAVGELIGVFVAPDSLPGKPSIQIGLGEEMTTLRLPGGNLVFNELTLSLEPNGHQ